MINFRMLSEKDFRTSNSDYAKSLRSTFGDDGYQKYVANINSIIEEARVQSEKTVESPVKKNLEARIKYLEEALEQATKTTIKKKNFFQRLCAKLSGMLRLTKSDEADHAIAQRDYAKADGDEDFYRFELLNALHEKGVMG